MARGETGVEQWRLPVALSAGEARAFARVVDGFVGAMLDAGAEPCNVLVQASGMYQAWEVAAGFANPVGYGMPDPAVKERDDHARELAELRGEQSRLLDVVQEVASHREQADADHRCSARCVDDLARLARDALQEKQRPQCGPAANRMRSDG